MIPPGLRAGMKGNYTDHDRGFAMWTKTLPFDKAVSSVVKGDGGKHSWHIWDKTVIIHHSSIFNSASLSFSPSFPVILELFLSEHVFIHVSVPFLPSQFLNVGFVFHIIWVTSFFLNSCCSNHSTVSLHHDIHFPHALPQDKVINTAVTPCIPSPSFSLDLPHSSHHSSLNSYLKTSSVFQPRPPIPLIRETNRISLTWMTRCSGSGRAVEHVPQMHSLLAVSWGRWGEEGGEWQNAILMLGLSDLQNLGKTRSHGLSVRRQYHCRKGVCLLCVCAHMMNDTE